jgi:phosphatidate phosphatase
MEPVSFLKITFDILVIAALLVIFECIKLFGTPFKSSFYCNDFSVNMPFKKSTVSNLALIFFSLIMPFFIMLATELFSFLFNKYSSSGKSQSRARLAYQVKFIKMNFQLPQEIGNLYRNFGSFFFGLALTANLTDLIKIIVGRLRPNFLSVCIPDVTDPYKLCLESNRTYLEPGTDFFCTSQHTINVADSRKSFPSGHASLSFYSAIFLILFINKTWNFRLLGLLPRFIQFGFVTLATFTSLSRITDNKHHTSDVIAGALLGIVFALLTFYYLTNDPALQTNKYKMSYHTIQPNNIDINDAFECVVFDKPRINGNALTNHNRLDTNNGNLNDAYESLRTSPSKENRIVIEKSKKKTEQVEQI